MPWPPEIQFWNQGGRKPKSQKYKRKTLFLTLYGEVAHFWKSKGSFFRKDHSVPKRRFLKLSAEDHEGSGLSLCHSRSTRGFLPSHQVTARIGSLGRGERSGRGEGPRGRAYSAVVPASLGREASPHAPHSIPLHHTPARFRGKHGNVTL